MRCTRHDFSFDADNSPKSADAATGPHIRGAPNSYSVFIRCPWFTVLTGAPVFAGFSATSVFIWRSFAERRGPAGTVWGDYATSALPALALFLACWAAVNLGSTFAAITEAFNRDRKGLSTTAVVVVLVAVIGILLGFFCFADLPTGPTFVIAAGAFVLSVFTSIGTRSWTLAHMSRIASSPSTARDRASRTGPIRRGQCPPGTGSETEFKRGFWTAPGTEFGTGPRTGFGADSVASRPPFDMLEPGERLIRSFRSDRTPEPQMLIATTERFVRASILHPDRTYVLEQASPGKLLGISSERMGPDLVTTAHFSDRQTMRVVGGDPTQSRSFAAMITRLTRTGRLRR